MKPKGDITVSLAVVYTIVTVVVSVVSSWYAAQASTSEKLSELKQTDALHEQTVTQIQNDMGFLKKGVNALLWKSNINPNSL